MAEGNFRQNPPQRSLEYQIFCVHKPTSGPENGHGRTSQWGTAPSSVDDGPLGRKKVKTSPPFVELEGSLPCSQESGA
jgi:hypothetical protein